ncbi:transporter [Rhodopseudomonas pseudopalustris]|uniref:Putative MetA-pathway of phenol degradation n=1 Tax=Rhodopseudomonas pseudopalustris TaxID=1513892 RepID=A0A1H8XBG0_9BRAD|nr:transporter [Rhodopseudomonas pseudopalustris]SEP37192.1 Putative MetA-pathway of phenol degradation [Rhodopseudomonas pseudopalustris]
MKNQTYAVRRRQIRGWPWRRLLVTAATVAVAGASTAAADEAPSWFSAPASSRSGFAMQHPPTVPGTHHAEGVDTEHIFGFSMGSDIGQKGEIEVELENVGSFGKRDGRYATLSTLTQVKYTLTDRIRIAPGLSFGGQQIDGVLGYDDRHHLTFNGAALEFRYKLIDRKAAPFGLTLHAQPNWSRVDEASGGRIEQYGGEFAALFDRELIAERLFAAFNVWYGTGATRDLATNTWAHDSELQLHGGLSYAFAPGFLAGLNVRYLRAYDGGGLDRFLGDAVYVGPTFSYNVSPAFGISGTWQFQVAGGALGDRRPLNLDHFERQQAMLRLNWHF